MERNTESELALIEYLTPEVYVATVAFLVGELTEDRVVRSAGFREIRDNLT